MGWSAQPTNNHLALAASIFVGVGTVILNIVNLAMTSRVVRSQHSIGHSRIYKVMSRILIICIVVTIMLLVIAGVQASYTLDTKTRQVDRRIQLYGTTFNSVISFLPLPIIVLSIITVHRSWRFAPSTERRRVLLVSTAGFLLTFRSVWLCISLWQPLAAPTRPLQWYFSKPVYYLVALVPELLVVYLLALGRYDKYFYTSPHGTFFDAGSKTVSPDPSIIRFPGTPMSPDHKRGWMSPRKTPSPTYRNQIGPQSPYGTQHGQYPPNPSVRLPMAYSRNMCAEDLKPPRLYNGNHNRSHESLVAPNMSHDATPVGYGTPAGSMTPKRSMEFPKQSLDYPEHPDIERYPLPVPPPPVHRDMPRDMPRASSVYSRNTTSLRHDHPSLQLISNLASGASLAEALRMSRSSILIDPSGTWTFISSDQQPQNAMLMDFSDAPPMPPLPPLNFDDSRLSTLVGSTRSQGGQTPLNSHPIQAPIPPVAQSSTVSPQYPQFHTPIQRQAQQAQPQQQLNSQAPTLTRSTTSPPLEYHRSSGSSDDRDAMVSPLRPAMKRAAKSASASMSDTSKQVSFVSNGTSSMGLSTMVGIAERASEYPESREPSAEWWIDTQNSKRLS